MIRKIGFFSNLLTLTIIVKIMDKEYRYWVYMKKIHGKSTNIRFGNMKHNIFIRIIKRYNTNLVRFRTEFFPSKTLKLFKILWKINY